MNNLAANKGLLSLVFHLIALFLFHQFGYIGHYGFDDMHYAKLASNLLNGEINFDDHFSFRITLIATTALFYSLFGINDFASALPSLIACSWILIMVYQILKKEEWSSINLALSLCLFSTWFISYAGKLMPDMLLAAFAFWSIYVYSKFKYFNPNETVFKYALLFSIAVFLAFNTKGTILLLLPLYFVLLIQDLNNGLSRKFWLYSFLIGLFLLTGYGLFSFIISGAFEQRFIAIASNTYLNHCSYDAQSIQILVKRISYELFSLLQREGILFIYVFVLFGFLKSNFRALISRTKPGQFFIVASVLLLLSSNFMSISWSSYNPMCLDARHYLFLLPIGALAAAFSISSLNNQKKETLGLTLLLLFFAICSYIDGNGLWKQLAIPAIILFLLASFLFSKWKKEIISLGVSLLLVIQLIPNIQYAQDVQYRKQAEEIQEIIKNHDEGIVLCNTIQKRIANYYQSFNSSSRLTFISYNEFDSKSHKEKQVYLLKNPHFRNLMFLAESELPFYAQHTDGAAELLFESKITGIQFFSLNKIREPNTSGEILIESLQDFESENQYWTVAKDFFSEEHVFSGKYGQLIPEYSSTFIYPLDSIHLGADKILFIESSCLIWVADKTKASLVISIETESGNLLYANKGISDFVASYSNWWTAKLNASISTKRIIEGSVLKVYLYNPDLNSIYLDEFKIRLIEMK